MTNSIIRIGCAIVAGLVILACGGTGDDQAFLPVVDVSATSNDTFSPEHATAFRGQTVRWTNNDADAHTVEPDVANSDMDSDAEFPNGIPTGSSFEFTIPSNATIGTLYYYHCRFHGTAGNGTSLGGGMAGVVEVVP